MIGGVKQKLFTIKIIVTHVTHESTHRVLLFNQKLKVKMEVQWGWSLAI